MGSYTSTKKKRRVSRIGDLRSEIDSVNKAFMDAYNRGDATAVAAHYTEGGRVLPPNAETVTGRQAIQAMWQGAMDMGVKEVKLETVELMLMVKRLLVKLGSIT